MASLDHCEQLYFLKQRPDLKVGDLMWTLLDREHCGLKLEPKRGLKMGLLAQVGCPRGLIILLRCKLQLGTHRTCHLIPGWLLWAFTGREQKS